MLEPATHSQRDTGGWSERPLRAASLALGVAAAIAVASILEIVDVGHVAAAPLLLGSGIVVSLLIAAVSTTITIERRRSARVLSVERECRTALLNHLPVAVFDERVSDQQIRFTPSRYASIAGRPAGVWLDRWARLEAIHPDDVAAVVDQLREADETGEACALRFRLRQADGEYAWIEEHVSNTTANGKEPSHRFGLLFDVTSLQLTERLYESLIEQVPAGIRIYDTNERRLTFVSDYYRRMHELSPAQIAGEKPLGWADHLHPDDHQRVVDGWRHAAERGQPWADQYRWLRDDGEVRWIADRESAVAGMEHLRLGVAVDVTEQVTTQVRFEEMISHIPAAVGVVDTKHDRVLYLSPYIERLTGEPATHWMRPGGRQEIVRRANPDDLPPGWGGGEVLEGTRIVEFRWTRPDGEVRWLRNYGTHLPGTDGIVQTMTFDLTEERRVHTELGVQQERYKKLVENIPAATFINTIAGDVSFVSPQIEQITGYTPDEWMAGPWGERLQRHYHPEDHEQMDALDSQLRAGDIEMYERECRLRDKQGGWRTALRRAQRVTLPDGAIEIHGVIIDVTETREAQRRSRDALNALVSAAEVEQARIASELHDDTVQVLVAALMRIRLAVARGATREQLESVADTLEQALERARRLMFELRPEILSREGLGPALEQLAADGPWQRADVIVDLPRLATTTEALAYRTVREIVINARKHSHASTLVIRGELCEEHLVIEVADDGVGFDPKEAFDRDVKRLHLGLATTFERVALAGGTVDVDAAPNCGARFTVTLPAERAAGRAGQEAA